MLTQNLIKILSSHVIKKPVHAYYYDINLCLDIVLRKQIVYLHAFIPVFLSGSVLTSFYIVMKYLEVLLYKNKIHL
jgi:hypothetical protein